MPSLYSLVVLAVAVSALPSKPRDVATVLANLETIDSDTKTLTTTINAWDASLLGALGITSDVSTLEVKQPTCAQLFMGRRMAKVHVERHHLRHHGGSERGSGRLGRLYHNPYLYAYFRPPFCSLPLPHSFFPPFPPQAIRRRKISKRKEGRSPYEEWNCIIATSHLHTPTPTHTTTTTTIHTKMTYTDTHPPDVTGTLGPDITAALNALTGREDDFAALGITSLVVTDLQDLQEDTDALGDALIAIASSDTEAEAETAVASIDTAFASAIAAFQ